MKHLVFSKEIYDLYDFECVFVFKIICSQFRSSYIKLFHNY